MKSNYLTTGKTGRQTIILLPILTVLAICFLLPACWQNTGKLPVNEAKASEEIIPFKLGVAYQDSFLSAHASLKELLKDTNFLETKFRMPNAETFNRDAMATLMNTPGAEGVRVYMGIDKTGELKFVLVPVDKNGKDIVSMLLYSNHVGYGTTQPLKDVDSQLVENGQVCPPCMLGGE